jgi:hypothetical protein
MSPEVTITLRTIDDSTAKNKKVKESFESLAPGVEKAGKALTGFVSANATLIGGLVAAGAAVKAAYGEYAKLSESIRDLSLVSGASAEEASRFIQVLDDYQLTAEDAVTASRFLKEKGLVPNIDTLAKLSDEFKAIQDPAKRLEFVQENLGRGGAKWVNILSQESDALRDAAKAVNEHLVMSDKQIAEYEQQRLALDELSDSWTAAKVAAGAFFGEMILSNKAVERANEILREQGKQGYANQFQTKQYQEALAQAREEQEAQTRAMIDNESAAASNEQAIEDLVKQQKALSEANKEYLSLVGDVSSSYDTFKEKEGELREEQAQLLEEKKNLIAQGYHPEGETIQAINEKLAENAAAYKANTDEYELDGKRRILSMLEQRLAIDGLDEREMNYLLSVGEQWGIYSSTAIEEAKRAMSEVEKLSAAINAVPESKNVTITVTSSGSNITSYNQNGEGIMHGRAAGGPVSAGTPYIVGERGPEMFVPGQSGGIVPNHRIGGSDEETKGLLRQIAANRFNENRFAAILRDAMISAGIGAQ